MNRGLIAALLALALPVAANASDSTREELKQAEAAMKEATSTVQQGVNDALMVIREITDENAASRTSEVLEAIEAIENQALTAIDQLALNGAFMNALNDARIEIRQTLKTVEKMEPSPNRDRNLEILKSQAERFDELQQSISRKEGEITLQLAQFTTLKRDIELSIRIGKITELIGSLESVQAHLDNMSHTLGEVLEYQVGDVEIPVTN
ncbi:hypothetical protein [Marichromatium bheemlicum]|uniref:YfdX protein n=1 Tax=Marichromatium bheemlicum TaxID=365339 RepID=A0ABX1I4X3_9GAMM|nr:hypothetical protein [Marichromatium bheemlicum]NKN31691.1 hypothetical protein [Marichromatium bheemlicum]